MASLQTIFLKFHPSPRFIFKASNTIITILLEKKYADSHPFLNPSLLDDPPISFSSHLKPHDSQ